MAGFRQQFEADLKAKLEQKSSFSTSAETVLLRAFKYFDLDNSGAVSFQEFTKAIEKIGVIADPNQLRGVFDEYDAD
jgi:Ca2+-binding EF-hand superfamily protein